MLFSSAGASAGNHCILVNGEVVKIESVCSVTLVQAVFPIHKVYNCAQPLF